MLSGKKHLEIWDFEKLPVAPEAEPSCWTHAHLVGLGQGSDRVGLWSDP